MEQYTWQVLSTRTGSVHTNKYVIRHYKILMTEMELQLLLQASSMLMITLNVFSVMPHIFQFFHADHCHVVCNVLVLS